MAQERLGFIPHGPMDKASAYGAEDSRFDPWCGSPLLLPGTSTPIVACAWMCLTGILSSQMSDVMASTLSQCLSQML